MTQQLALMSSEPARPGRVGRLDEETKRVGREGLSKARAALQAASRRAAEREADRLTRRDQELARRAAAARAAALRQPGGPSVATPLVAAGPIDAQVTTSERRGGRSAATRDGRRPAPPARRAAA